MGHAKRLLEQSHSYTNLDAFVCPTCVTDEFLAATLAAAALDENCSYCGKKGAAEVSVLLEKIQDAIQAEYSDPAAVLPYCGEEGGYLGHIQGGDEIVQILFRRGACFVF